MSEIDPNEMSNFVITILIIILIPLTIRVVKPKLRGIDPKYKKAPNVCRKQLNWKRDDMHSIERNHITLKHLVGLF